MKSVVVLCGVLGVLLLANSSPVFSSEPASEPASVPAADERRARASFTRRSQGQWYGYWGWNRAHYSNSNIRFKGHDHDFTLHDVPARDRPTQVNAANLVNRYFNPGYLTIPQYNFRIGYFLDDNWSLSFGVDHMKYVVTRGQAATLSGRIATPGFEKHNPAAERKILSGDFMSFEHTDGLNMISLETEAFHSVWKLGSDYELAVLAGVGLGIMYPKSNIKLLGHARSDRFHVAGHARLVKTGFEISITPQCYRT